MYQEYFNLNSLPFENSPDPEFFFMGHRYREILALMIHGVVSRKGLICITGPIGSGKTTLAAVLTGYLPADTLVINMTHSKASPDEMLAYLAQQLGVTQYPDSPLLQTETIRQELVKRDNTDLHCVLIIDESQYMSDALMQEIVVLTNLETPRRKLIQILLLGQKEFIGKLNRPELRQLKHRIFVTRSLAAMDPEQSFQYIRHRLQVANGGLDIFSSDALDLIFKYSGGIPRLINRLCDAALLGAFTTRKQRVEEKDVRNANVDLGMQLDTHVSAYRQTLRRPGMRSQSISAHAPTSEIQATPSQPAKSAESDRASENGQIKTTTAATPFVTDQSPGKMPSVHNRKMISASGRPERGNPRLKLIMFLFVIAVLAVGIILTLRGKNLKTAFISAIKPDKPEENADPTSSLKFSPIPEFNKEVGSDKDTNKEPDDIQTNSTGENVHLKERIKLSPIPQLNTPDQTVDDVKAELQRAHLSNSGAKEKTIHNPMNVKPNATVEPQLTDRNSLSTPTAALIAQDKVGLYKNNERNGKNTPEIQLETDPATALTDMAAQKKTAYPYSIFLDTLATYPKAVVALAQFKKKGLSPYWVKVKEEGGNGRFNIFSGYFESIEQAALAIQKRHANGTDSAIVMKTPYASLIGVYSSPDTMKARQQLLEQAGYVHYSVPGEHSDQIHLYVGAFYKIQDAETKCSELIEIGIRCEAVER